MPRKTRFRRSVVVAIAVLAMGLFGLATPAFADTTPDVSVIVSSPYVTPGQTITVTAQFTNTQATDVNFSYQSLSPTYDTTLSDGLDFSFVSCGGDDTWCDPNGESVAWYDSPPIAPGASQTVTLTYQVAADSACGAQSVRFNFYAYDEYNSDQNNESALFETSPETEVICA